MAMLVSMLIGSVLLVPALVYLYRLFQQKPDYDITPAEEGAS